MGRLLEILFTRIWVVMKLTLIWWLLAATGLFILGLGPATKSITVLYLDNEWDDKKLTLKRAYHVFGTDFFRGNLIFWFFTLIGGLLAYNLMLSAQIRGLLFLMIDFILIFALTYLMTAFEYALILDSQFEMSLKNLFKMSFISNFVSFSTYLKMLLGTVALLVLTWQFKGLILFGIIGLLQIYCIHVTKNWRQEIDEKLAEDEEELA